MHNEQNLMQVESLINKNILLCIIFMINCW